LGVEVASASRAAASAISPSGRDSDFQVVAIHEADIIEVVSVGTVESKLRQRSRRLTSCTCTLEESSTVAGFAAPSSMGIKSAASATPEPTSPSCFHLIQRHFLSCW